MESPSLKILNISPVPFVQLGLARGNQWLLLRSLTLPIFHGSLKFMEVIIWDLSPPHWVLYHHVTTWKSFVIMWLKSWDLRVKLHCLPQTQFNYSLLSVDLALSDCWLYAKLIFNFKEQSLKCWKERCHIL